MKDYKIIKRCLALLVALGLCMSAGCDISPIPTPIPGAETGSQEPFLLDSDTDVLNENGENGVKDNDASDSDVLEEDDDTDESAEEEEE
jgi:hypothetical protein